MCCAEILCLNVDTNCFDVYRKYISTTTGIFKPNKYVTSYYISIEGLKENGGEKQKRSDDST